MKHRSPLDYTFAVAKIRVMENHLVDSEAFRLAAESEVTEACKIFVEEGMYSDRLLHVANSHELETVLSEEKRQKHSLIGNLLLDQWLLPIMDMDSMNGIQTVLSNEPGPFLDTFLRHRIDMHNLKTFLRLYSVRGTNDLLTAHLAPNGCINISTLLTSYDLGLSALLHNLEHIRFRNQVIDYASFFREAIEIVEKKGSFAALEKRINDYLIMVMKRAKTIVFGPEPLLAYFWARTNEMSLIRLVLLGKWNQFPTERIKERLNDAYA